MSRLDRFAPLGYSAAGAVVEVGELVDDIAVGDLAACAGAGYASHAEAIYVPRNLAVRVPDGVSPTSAAFATLGAIAMQGIRRAELSPGESVGVVGLGLVGQLTVRILRAYGFPVAGFDPRRSRVEKALACGMEAGCVLGEDEPESTAEAISGSNGVDAVVLTAATESNEPLKLAGLLMRDRGRVSLVGDVGMEAPRRTYYGKELDIRLSRSYGPGRYDPSYEEHGLDYPIGHVRWTERRNMAEFLRLVAAGRIAPEELITRRCRIDEAANVYRSFVDGNGSDESLAVVIDYPSDDDALRSRINLPATARRRSGKSDVLRVGLIGAGNFARSTIIPALSGFADVEIAAVASMTGRTARDVADRHGARYATTDYRELIGDTEIDLVVAATVHNLNAAIAVECLLAGKNVHVEKPLALNRSDLQRVIEAKEISDAILMVGFNRRFAPYSIAVRQHFADRHGPLLMNYRINTGPIPTGNWQLDPVVGGGRVLGEVCHFVDLFQYFAGSPPRQVFADRAHPAAPDSHSDANIAATVHFEDGSVGSVSYSDSGADSMPKEFLEVLAFGRSATLDDFRRLVLYQGHKRREQKARQDKGHRAEFQALIDAIRGDADTPIPAPQLFATTLATINILESLQTAIPVPVDLARVASSPDVAAVDPVQE